MRYETPKFEPARAFAKVAGEATVIELSDGAEWIVLYVDSQHAKIYETVFTGAHSKERALEYAAYKYSSFRTVA